MDNFLRYHSCSSTQAQPLLQVYYWLLVACIVLIKMVVFQQTLSVTSTKRLNYITPSAIYTVCNRQKRQVLSSQVQVYGAQNVLICLL